jgi:uncharacterized protein YggT (Ycf19 family)
MDSTLVKTLTLLRLVAFMVLLYLGLGWIAERYATRPDSKVKAFFRLICAPITRPIARAMPPGTGERRVLAVSIGVVAAVWVLLIVATEALRAR